MPLPDSFIQHLRDLGYHPRSDKHSNALARAVLQDLVKRCPRIREDAAAGRLVYDLNMDIRFGTSTWNVDFVLGSPAIPALPVAGEAITRLTPATVRVALEIKGVMTEHRKAVRNRKRDFEAHHEHVHNYSQRTIAAGLLVINSAAEFKSALRPVMTIHGDRRKVSTLVDVCLNEMRNVTTSGGMSNYGMDAKGAIVVDMDNVNLAEARFMTVPPAPQPGDPLHYDSFVQRLCDEYSERFR